MTTQQQTERDEALIAEKKRLADELERMYNGAWADDAVTLRHAAALLRGDEPAKPDRYLEIWKKAEEASLYARELNRNSGQAAAAVIRREFEALQGMSAVTDNLREVLSDILILEREKARAKGYSDCTCMAWSRDTERLYENGKCVHQRAIEALREGDVR